VVKALGLVVQVGVAFYLFSRSWGSGMLTFRAIPVFIVGILKYAERTWVLWSSSSEGLEKVYSPKVSAFLSIKGIKKNT